MNGNRINELFSVSSSNLLLDIDKKTKEVFNTFKALGAKLFIPPRNPFPYICCKILTECINYKLQHSLRFLDASSLRKN